MKATSSFPGRKQRIGVADSSAPPAYTNEVSNPASRPEGLSATLSGEAKVASATFQVEDDPSSQERIDLMMRMGFVRKVYGILAVQLCVTFGMVALFQTHAVKSQMMECPQMDGMNVNSSAEAVDFSHYPPQCDYAWEAAPPPPPDSRTRPDRQAGTHIAKPTSLMKACMLGGYGVSFAALIMLVCCIENARTFPRNYMLLTVFTVAEGFFLASYCVFSQAGTVLLAAGMTTAITVALSLFACQTTIDFTGMGSYLYAALWTLILFGFAMSFFGDMVPGMQKLYLGGGVLLFSFYIVYDTQLIVGGKHKKMTIGLDDYVIAALAIYLDIINMFMFILAILNGERD